jgi:hypothetical protein
MKTKLFIVLLFFSLCGYFACNEKFPNPSPESIPESQTNVRIKLQSLPDGADGKDGVLFVIKDDDIYSNKTFEAEEEKEVFTYLPEEESYDVMVYISKEGEWSPKKGFETGWYSKVSDQTITDEVSQLNLYSESWSTNHLYPGNLDNIINCDIHSPIEDSTFEAGDIINVEVNAQDNGTGKISELELYLDGSLLKSMSEAPYYHDINTNDISQGKHILEAVATNNDNLEGSDEITFFVDQEASNAPSLYFYEPDNGSRVELGEVQDVRLYINDDGEIKESTLYIDDDEVTDFDDKDEYTYRWKTENYDVGKHELKAVAVDDDNNERTRLINVEIEDTEKPIISFEKPEYGETLMIGYVYTIRVKAYDPDELQSVSLYIDGDYRELTESYSSNTYYYDWDTNNAYEGTYYLTLAATDMNGNYRSREIEVTLVNNNK